MQKVLLLRYSEIGLKSPRTKRSFVKKLKSNIKLALQQNQIADYQVIYEEGRFFIKSSQIELAALVIKKIF